MKISSVLLLSALLLLMGCTPAHLDIFPELDQPALMQTKIAPELLHQDVDALVNGVKARHPDYYGYVDEARLASTVAEVKTAIDRPMTRVEFYRHVGRLSHAFQDGHSFLLWPYQELDALREQGEKLFPFAISFTGDGAFVPQSYVAGELKIPAGSKIVSINGEPIADIFARTQDYVGGETQVLREAFVAERFGYMLWAVYGFIGQFDLELVHQGRQHTVNIDNSQSWNPADTAAELAHEDLTYQRLNASVGYLNVASFDIKPDAFSDQLESLFSRIAADQVTSLIIDVRRNSGGNTDTATELTQYIASKRFRLVSRMTEKLNEDNRGLFNYKGLPGDMLSNEWDDYHSPKNSPHRFTGEVIVLVGPATYSAAIVFATAVKDHQFGVLAGQSTGGYANQSAQGNLFNLPHSQLRAYVATRLLVRPDGDAKVSVVVPDIAVDYSLADQQKGIDTVLQHVVQHLSNNLPVKQAAR